MTHSQKPGVDRFVLFLTSSTSFSVKRIKRGRAWLELMNNLSDLLLPMWSHPLKEELSKYIYIYQTVQFVFCILEQFFFLSTTTDTWVSEQTWNMKFTKGEMTQKDLYKPEKTGAVMSKTSSQNTGGSSPQCSALAQHRNTSFKEHSHNLISPHFTRCH